MQHKELLRAVNVHSAHHRDKRPPDKAFAHVHANHGCGETGSGTITPSTNIDIVVILALSDKSPVLFDWRLEFSSAAPKNVLVKEFHSEVYRHLVIDRDAPVLRVQTVEVVASSGL